MRRLAIFGAAVLLCLAQAGFADSSGIPTERPKIVIPVQAIRSADAWLRLVDDGNSRQSWDESSTFFQAHVPLLQWADTVSNVRQSFGRVIARSFLHGDLAERLPGAPDGQYAVLRFSIGARRWAKETVTLKLEDGAWKVAGYYISSPTGLFVPGVGALPLH